jgi:hypothetical protein
MTNQVNIKDSKTFQVLLPGRVPAVENHCCKGSKAGVGNSFCLAGHIGNTFGLRGPVSVT